VFPERVLPWVCEPFRPDVLVVNGVPRRAWTAACGWLKAADLPVVLYIREAPTFEHLPIGEIRPDAIVTNCDVYRDRVAALGLPAVTILSLIEMNECEVETSREVTVLGIINALLLSVYERTRELGLLRIVGMSRVQLRRMVGGESIIIAVIGGVVGLGLGIFWGWAFTTALREQGLDQFDVPPLQVAGFLVFSVIAGTVAAPLPAWRASRLDVSRQSPRSDTQARWYDRALRAVSSGGEHFLDAEGVRGSNPLPPTL
jgi:hypothetical protein